MIEDKVITVEEGLKLIETLKDQKQSTTKGNVEFHKVDDLASLDDDGEAEIIIDQDGVTINSYTKDDQPSEEDGYEKVEGKDKKERFAKFDGIESLEELGEKLEKTFGAVGKMIESKVGEFKEQVEENKNREEVVREYNIDYSDVNEIDINILAGDINVLTEKREDILIIGRGYLLANGEDFLAIEKINGKLEVKNNKFKQKGAFFTFLNNIKAVDLEIRLPELYKESLTLKTVSGDFDIRNIALDFLKVNTVSGDIDANEIHTNGAVIKTTSGDVEIAEITGDAKIVSVSGDLDVNVKELNGSIEGKSVSGDLKFSLPSDAQFALNMKSVSGDLDCAFEVEGLKVSKKSNIEANVGVSDNLIHLITTAGDIELSKK